MIGPLIGAAASIAGGLLGNKAQKDGTKANEAQALRQEALQKEFAQSGIQWKVKDAEAAGIHPLYALGANTASYQPTNVGGGAADFSFIGEAGQNIGRAIDATRSTPASTLALQATKTQIEGLQLDNELKRTQLASAYALANQTGPHAPLPSFGDVHHIAGQGDSGVVSSIPPGHEARQPQQTDPALALWGRKWERSPWTKNTSDASNWEDVYGDENPVNFAIQGINSYLDLLHNSYRSYKSGISNKLRR